MTSCIVNAGYTMVADVLREHRGFDPDTGEKTHDWKYEKTIRCNVVPYIEGGVRGLGSAENFSERYKSQDNARAHSQEKLNKRDRLTNVRNSRSKELVWYEEISGVIEPMVFNVDGSAPVINPITGKPSEWVMGLSRAEVRV